MSNIIALSINNCNTKHALKAFVRNTLNHCVRSFEARISERSLELNPIREYSDTVQSKIDYGNGVKDTI
jgi:phage portal protein BeeE